MTDLPPPLAVVPPLSLKRRISRWDRLRRWIRQFGLVLAVMGGGIALVGCGGSRAETVARCDTSDLDSKYWDALILGCYDFVGPLHECEAYPQAANAYEAAVVARCGK